MAWGTTLTEVTTTSLGTLVYTAAGAVTVRIRASSTVRLGASPIAGGIPINPGEVLTLELSSADEVYARCVARPGAGQPTSGPRATVWVAAGP